MHCSRARTALSARCDGEELPAGLTARRLDDHLAGCPDCRRWEAHARALTRHLDRAAARAEEDAAASVDALLAGLRSVTARPAAAVPGAGAPDTGDEPTG